jgi:putative phosphoesterase
MRIGLISDTHIAWEFKEIPRQVFDLFSGVDMIFHGGDIYAHHVLDELGIIAPVISALGDDDYASPDPRIKEKHVIDIEGHRIWLIHEGPDTSLTPEWTSVWCRRRIEKDSDDTMLPDIIVAGHEHRSFVQRKNGLIYVNPGSPTYPEYRYEPGTIGIMNISQNNVDVDIIQL